MRALALALGLESFRRYTGMHSGGAPQQHGEAILSPLGVPSWVVRSALPCRHHQVSSPIMVFTSAADATAAVAAALAAGVPATVRDCEEVSPGEWQYTIGVGNLLTFDGRGTYSTVDVEGLGATVSVPNKESAVVASLGIIIPAAMVALLNAAVVAHPH